MKKRRYYQRSLLKRWLAMTVAFIMIVGSFGMQSGNAEAAGKKVKKVVLTNPAISKLTLEVGMSYQLETKVLPKKASNKILSFTSSNDSVVSVSTTGELKALKTGTSSITVKATDGSKKEKTVTVTVVKKLIKTKKVELNVNKKTLYLRDDDGKTFQLTASLYPENSTNRDVYFVSSNKAVATVDKDGEVTAVDYGTTVISAYPADGWGKKAECKVTVKFKKFIPTVTPTPTPTTTPTPTPTPKVASTVYQNNNTYYGGTTAVNCTCNLTEPVITTGTAIEIPFLSTSVTTSLDAVSSIGNCIIVGHKKNITYTYSIIEDPNKIASLSGKQLTVTDAGTITIQVTATANGFTKTTTKKIIVKNAEADVNYKNWALSTNGGNAKAYTNDLYATVVGVNDAPSINDGNRLGSNNNYWKANKIPAYVELKFNGMKKINVINLFSLQDSTPYKEPTSVMTSSNAISSFKISYLKKGAWEQIGDTVTGNSKVLYKFLLKKPIDTSEIRIEILEAPAGGVNVVEAEAWGVTSICTCQMEKPTITNKTTVKVKEGTGAAVTFNLNSKATYNTDICQMDVHKGNTPTYTYNIISDVNHVAAITGDAITFYGAGDVVVEVKATLNDITKTSQTTFHSKLLLANELLINGDFEDGKAPWQPAWNATIEVVSNDTDGGNCMKITNREREGSSLQQDLTGKMVVGHTYQVTARVKYTTGRESQTFNFSVFHGTEPFSDIEAMGSATVKKGEWTTITGTYTLTSSKTPIVVFVENPYGSNDKNEFYVDDLSIVDITKAK